jgi:hypothetical protein
MLADIYNDYRSALLERNVRSFLQFNGKVNKGIRDTLKTAPHRFLPYNNGLSTTASSVVLTGASNGTAHIRSLADFQIVNGGQTTASIAAASRRDIPPGNPGAPSQCKRAAPPPVCPASRREAVAVQLSCVTVSFRVTVPFPCPSEEAGADQRLPRWLALSFGSCEAPLPRSGWGPEFFQALPPLPGPDPASGARAGRELCEEALPQLSGIVVHFHFLQPTTKPW